jgi:ATP/maltotriose-dependent transcriptional regulator MalT
MEACREAVRLVPETPSLARARVTASLAQIMMNEMLFGDAQPFCEEAVSVARRVGAPEIESHALTTLGCCVLYLGDFEGGIRNLREGLAIGLRAESVEDAARAYANLVDVMNCSGHLAEAGQAAEEAFAFALAHGVARFFGVFGLCEGASALQRMGRWRDARALIERARRYEVPGTSELFVQERLVLLDVWQGRHRDAERRIERLRPAVEHTVEAQWVGPLAEAAAELQLWRGRPGDARAELDAAMQRLPVEEPGLVSRIGPLLALALRTEADAAALARVRRAQPELEASRAIADRHLGVIRSVRDIVTRERPNFASQAGAFSAICEAESGRLDGVSDPEQWAAASEAFGAIPMAYQRGYALWRQAEALLLRKSVNRSAAAGPLREAHAIAVDLDAAPLREEIERLAMRGRLDLGVEPPKRPASDALVRFGLTTREREVLNLLASGRTNRQIADELFITSRTAGHHVSTILAKLGVQGRTEAAATAHRLGLTSQTDPTALVDE